jgi:hypothetical protein
VIIALPFGLADERTIDPAGDFEKAVGVRAPVEALGCQS